MDSTSPPDFKRKSSHSSSPAEVGETARSPPDCSPFLSPSPPSSEPSSPFSSSSSVCGSTLVYKNNVKSQSEVARVSSTSTQPFATSMSNNASLEQSLGTAMQGVSFTTEDDEKTGMYDPYSITDKEKGRKLIVVEGHGEKYDPFDPTGSPQSDMDDGFDGEEILEENVKKDEEPPDSTEILMAQPSPSLTSQKHLRRRIESSSFKARRLREGIDSEHSEIEEGEIVGAGDRDGAKKKSSEEALILNSPSISFFGSKPERILRVLDGDGFVSVCTEESWEDDRELEDELAVGAEDLRRKLVSRRKERYLSFPASSPLSSQAPLTPFLPQASKSASPVKPSVEQTSKNHKSSKGSKDSDRQKSKEKKLGEKVVKRKKRRKGKEEGGEKSKEKEREKKDGKEVRTRGSSRSSSRKGKKRRHVSPEVSHHTSSKEAHSRRSFSSLSEERYRERDKDKDRTSYRERGRDTDRDRHLNRSSSHRNDENGRSLSSRRSEGEKKGKRHSSSRERGLPKRSNNSKDERESDGDRQHKKERRRDGRPVVPPSIQDLNGSDLFAIKRTITVTTTTTTTTVPGSPRLSAASPCRPVEDRKRIKWPSTNDTKDRERVRSRSRSLSPPRYHTYESDRYSDKLEIDMLSLDGEALDSDYPSLEDTPPAALPLEPPVPKPKAKPSPKTRQSHPKKKSHTIKKSDSSSNRTTNKCLSSLTVTSGPTSIAPCVTSAKRVRKVGKDKVRDKSNRKDLNRSCKSKKESGGSRKGKLQSKVSVLVREGVSSTTGASVGSGKLSMDLLGPGGTGGGAGGSVVGGSIAVVFCRDNESRSPFLKPCSEPLSLGGRSKDLAGIGKRSSLAGPPSSLTSPAGLKSKKPKPSSITSTSSSASSPTSSLATKRRRRLAKKNSKKGATSTLPPGNSSQAKSALEGWVGASFDAPSAVGDGSKSVSPHVAQAGPPPCSSSSSSSTSSSTSVLPPSSSPPHTPPPSNVPLRDTRESSPDSQTVDSSCKTPEPAFPPEDCPVQKSPSTPASSPSSLSTSQGAGLGSTLSTQTVKPPPPEDLPKTLASPPCSSSSAGLASLSLSLSSADPSSSSSVSSSSASKMPAPPPAAATLPWSLQTGVDCTTGGVLALTALLFKMEEANIASRAKAQEFIQATSQILSQANQNQSQHHVPPSSTSSSAQVPPPPTVPPPPGLSPDQFILHSSLPLVVCTKTPPPHLHASLGGGCAQTPPPMLPVGLSGAASGSGEAGWENENKDSDKYLKKLHTQERAVEEVKLAIKPYYQRKDINKNEYKDILRKAVHKICHSRTGEINPVKVSNLVKLYVQRYKYFRKHGRKMDEEEREDREQGTLYSSA